MLAQRDDHETTNNWYPGETLSDPRYQVSDVDLLAARARRAFHEYFPTAPVPGADGRIYRKVAYGPLLEVFLLDLRTYQGPNTSNDQPAPGDLGASSEKPRWPGCCASCVGRGRRGR